jgi:hypothetical protein
MDGGPVRSMISIHAILIGLKSPHTIPMQVTRAQAIELLNAGAHRLAEYKGAAVEHVHRVLRI